MDELKDLGGSFEKVVCTEEQGRFKVQQLIVRSSGANAKVFKHDY